MHLSSAPEVIVPSMMLFMIATVKLVLEIERNAARCVAKVIFSWDTDSNSIYHSRSLLNTLSLTLSP